MQLTNGVGRPVPFTLLAIKAEASQNGMTSIVTATCDDGTVVDISQHDSGTWDIAVDGEPADEFEIGEAKEAVQEFMFRVQTYNYQMRV